MARNDHRLFGWAYARMRQNGADAGESGRKIAAVPVLARAPHRPRFCTLGRICCRTHALCKTCLLFRTKQSTQQLRSSSVISKRNTHEKLTRYGKNMVLKRSLASLVLIFAKL